MITDRLGDCPPTAGTEAAILRPVGTTRLIDNLPLVIGGPGASMLRTMMKSKIHRATVTQATCTTSAR